MDILTNAVKGADDDGGAPTREDEARDALMGYLLRWAGMPVLKEDAVEAMQKHGHSQSTVQRAAKDLASRRRIIIRKRRPDEFAEKNPNAAVWEAL